MLFITKKKQDFYNKYGKKNYLYNNNKFNKIKNIKNINKNLNNNINLINKNNIKKFNFYKNMNFYIHSRQLYFFYKLVNNLIINGNKDKAINILYSIIFNLLNDEFYKKKDPFIILDKILSRSICVVKLKKKRIAGRVHQIPLFIKKLNQINYSLKFFVNSVKLRTEKTIILKLLAEIKAIYSKDISSIVWKRKKLLYLQVIANKFSVKYL